VRDRLRSGRRLAVRNDLLALALKASFGLKNSRELSVDHAASEPLPQTRWLLCGDISLKRQAFNALRRKAAALDRVLTAESHFSMVTKQLLMLRYLYVQQLKGGDPVSQGHVVSQLKISPAIGMRF
jgi:hypothetical protein